MATADVECGANGMAKVVSIRGAFAADQEDPEFTVRSTDYLIRSHALGLAFQAPLPVGMEQSPKNAALWCMNVFGKLAAFGTPHLVDGGIPEKPLRTHSLMHIAVARGDTNAADRHLQAGLPIELLAADGLAPLHWAFGRKDMKTAEFLLSRGSPVDVRSDQGATPLMTEVQRGEIEKITFLLDHGADVNAIDLRGFTSLHRVAEAGNADLVRLLLERGARPELTAAGQTALSLAEKRGHAEIVKLLKGTTH